MDTKTREYYFRRLAIAVEWIAILQEMIAKETNREESARLRHILGLEKQLSDALRRAINENRESLILL